jgi:hypothetical protein
MIRICVEEILVVKAELRPLALFGLARQFTSPTASSRSTGHHFTTIAQHATASVAELALKFFNNTADSECLPPEPCALDRSYYNKKPYSSFNRRSSHDALL